jgi:type IV pilus assembly protein PilM
VPKWFKPKYRSILGVDLSPTAVKVVEISCQGDKPCIESYGYENLPPNVIETTIIKDIDALAYCTQKLCAHINTSTKSAALAVPDSTVISKTIQIAAGLNEAELENLIFIEADNFLSYPADPINIDFSILGPSNKHPGMLDVFLVASRTENVHRRMEALLRAGLEAKIVDVESYAIARIVAQQLAKDIPDQNKLIAVIDINFLFIHFLILDNGKSVFTREESFNAQQWVDVSHQQPERNSQPIEMFRPFIDMIISQVKRFLQYFFAANHYDFVEHIFLAGELARLTELASLIEKETGIPTSVANPFKHFAVSNKLNLARLTNLAPSFLLACGLALRRCDV